MQQLKELFESLGLAKVETFIASGNVIFESGAKSAALLEQKIEKLLQSELRYEVKTFLRSDVEVAKIGAFEPFDRVDRIGASRLFIGFLKTAPDRETAARLVAAQTPVDDFRIHGRELYWHCRVPSSEAKFSGAKLEKTLGMPTTLRNSNTVQRLALRYAPR